MRKRLIVLFSALLMLGLASAAAESHTHTGGAATCDTLAVCSECGQSYGHLADHSWGAWIADDDATHTRTCQTNAAHTETRYHMGGASSCTEGAKCVMCGATHDAPLGHIPVANPGKAPACTSTGLSDGEDCSRCGETLIRQQVIPANGHSYNTWEPVEGGLHQAVCTVSGCGAVGTAECQPFEYLVDAEPFSVCPICGRCGETPFELLLSRMDDSLPMGQLLVRGMAEPFPGSLYAFTVTGSYAGKVIELDNQTVITLPLDLSALPAFTLLRVTESAEADGTLVIDEIPFRMDNGQLTFTAEKCGLYLLMPVE